MYTALSHHGISIRLTEERWAHIVEEHGELAGMRSGILDTISAPERIVAGNTGECLAIRPVSSEKWLVVVYKEDVALRDGFVITAFVTKRIRSLDRRRQVWP